MCTNASRGLSATAEFLVTKCGRKVALVGNPDHVRYDMVRDTVRLGVV